MFWLFRLNWAELLSATLLVIASDTGVSSALVLSVQCWVWSSRIISVNRWNARADFYLHLPSEWAEQTLCWKQEPARCSGDYSEASCCCVPHIWDHLNDRFRRLELLSCPHFNLWFGFVTLQWEPCYALSRTLLLWLAAFSFCCLFSLSLRFSFFLPRAIGKSVQAHAHAFLRAVSFVCLCWLSTESILYEQQAGWPEPALTHLWFVYYLKSKSQPFVKAVLSQKHPYSSACVSGEKWFLSVFVTGQCNFKK